MSSSRRRADRLEVRVVTQRTELRLDMTATRGDAVELLERLVAFARELEALGLRVVVTGDVGVVVETVNEQLELIAARR
jgi:hypothetical protein